MSKQGGARFTRNTTDPLLSIELPALLNSFKDTMTEFGGCADPLKLDWRIVAVGQKGAAHDDRAALRSWARPLDHDEVSLDAAVVDKTANGVNALVCQVELCCTAPRILCGIDHEDLLVGIRAVEVTHLTSAGNGVLDVGRVPRANASDLSVSTPSLARKTSDAPAGNDALEPTTACDGNGVDLLSYLENILN